MEYRIESTHVGCCCCCCVVVVVVDQNGHDAMQGDPIVETLNEELESKDRKGVVCGEKGSHRNHRTCDMVEMGRVHAGSEPMRCGVGKESACGMESIYLGWARHVVVVVMGCVDVW